MYENQNEDENNKKDQDQNQDFENDNNNYYDNNSQDFEPDESNITQDESNNKYNSYNNSRKKKNKSFGVIALVCLGCIIGGTAIGTSFGIANGFINKFLEKAYDAKFNSGSQTKKEFSFENADSTNKNNNNSSGSNSNTNNYTESDAKQDMHSIIDKVSKSVVEINTISSVTDDIFFGFPFQSNYEKKGSGSGIIFHKDNEKIYIVTNCHVIDGANVVNIKIENSEDIPARPLGKNVLSDLAVIYIEKKELDSKNIDINNINIAKFGDSDKIYLGENIIAIGNALGEGNTVTSGIISAKEKKINIDGKELNVIQVDASINPGNSGGALVNLKGEVVGITTAKYARFAVEGMSYCIPSNTAKPIIETIFNQPSKPYLGIYGESITDSISSNYGLPKIGVYVSSVKKDSNADKSGIKTNDIITMVDNKTIHTIEELSNILEQHKIGDKITVHVMRNYNGEYRGLDINVELNEYQEANF